MQALKDLFFGAVPLLGHPDVQEVLDQSRLIETPIGHDNGNLIIPVKDGGAEIEKLRAENAALQLELKDVKRTHFKLSREFQPYIDHMPVNPQELYGQACSSDKVTVDSWRPTWISNVKKCKAKFGGFKSHGIGQFLGKNAGGAAIVAGSGPSLKRNAEHLRNRPSSVPLVSALHNYAYLLDRGIVADYYITLDAGHVVVDEMSDGGQESDEFYWNSTKDKTLCAFIGSDPDLFEKWQGKIALFSAPIPDVDVNKAMDDEEPGFHQYISAGGNVLGGSTYFARTVLGAFTIVWVGNDQAFSYDKQFYDWDHGLNGTPGDHAITWPDVFGIAVKTWPSYFNFKCWFDFITNQVPGIWINATEGGIIGSYREGNIRSVKQMALCDVMNMFRAHEGIKTTFEGTQDPPMVLF